MDHLRPLRPLHTSAVIFAFGGNALLGTSLYVVQRTCRATCSGGPLVANFLFWGYQLFIVMAASGYVWASPRASEYAEPEWYVDLWLTVVWVVYLLTFVGTIMQRREEPHIYVANWFYLAFIVTIAMLHIVNNLAVPVSFFGAKSYSLFAGVQDALCQWWYGHNAVGFFLTAGFLGMMYYFVPKQAERPVYSYRLSIIHFWALIFLYIWAGPAPPALHGAARLGADARHDLLDHAVDAVLGRHDQRPDDPVGRLGQAAHRPGPALPGGLGRLLRHEHLRGPGDVDQGRSTRSATTPTGPSATSIPAPWAGSPSSASARSTTWCRSCGRCRGSTRLSWSSWHFWIATIGIVLYITAMWISGIMQGLMWRAYDHLGFLQYLVRRDGRGDASLLRDPRLRRRPVPRRRPDHGLQPLAHQAIRVRSPTSPPRAQVRAGCRVRTPHRNGRMKKPGVLFDQSRV